MGIGRLYANDFEDNLYNFSSACMVKEMRWAGIDTGGVLTFRIVLMHLPQINSINKF